LDEPSSNLDKGAIERLRQTLERMISGCLLLATGIALMRIVAWGQDK
jgi:DNA repair exonuclease SbcCD ATPase subunit